jgi:hypothetical protein
MRPSRDRPFWGLDRYGLLNQWAVGSIPTALTTQKSCSIFLPKRDRYLQTGGRSCPSLA